MLRTENFLGERPQKTLYRKAQQGTPWDSVCGSALDLIRLTANLSATSRGAPQEEDVKPNC